MSAHADRFSDSYIKRTILKCITVDDKPVSLAEFKRLCAEARAKGYTVIPPCDNVKPNGHCAGHLELEDAQALITGGDSL